MGDTHFVTLSDGRRLAYADYSEPAAPTILYCVGTPESRLAHPVALRERGAAIARLIREEIFGWLERSR